MLIVPAMYLWLMWSELPSYVYYWDDFYPALFLTTLFSLIIWDEKRKKVPARGKDIK